MIDGVRNIIRILLSPAVDLEPVVYTAANARPMHNASLVHIADQTCSRVSQLEI